MRERGPLIALVASFVVVLLLVVGLLLPKMSAVGQAREQLETAEQAEVSLEAQLAQLEEARKQAARVQKQLRKLEVLVPPTVDQQGILNLLKRAADRAAVDFMSIAPGIPTPSTTGVSIVPLTIAAAGSFFAIDEFLFLLETLPRAMRVTAINVAPAGAEGQLSLNITAEVFTTDASVGPNSEPGPTEPMTTITPAPVPTVAPGG